jgi:hypothetical protein
MAPPWAHVGTAWHHPGQGVARHGPTLGDWWPGLAPRWARQGNSVDKAWPNIGRWMAHVGTTLGGQPRAHRWARRGTLCTRWHHLGQGKAPRWARRGTSWPNFERWVGTLDGQVGAHGCTQHPRSEHQVMLDFSKSGNQVLFLHFILRFYVKSSVSMLRYGKYR